MAPVPGSLFTHRESGVKQSVSAEMRGIYVTQKSHNILKDCNQAILYFSTAFQPLNAASKPGNLLDTRQPAIIQITRDPLCTSPCCQTNALPSHIKKCTPTSHAHLKQRTGSTVSARHPQIPHEFHMD